MNDEQYESILKVMNSRDENNRRDAMYDSRNFRKQERNVNTLVSSLHFFAFVS